MVKFRVWRDDVLDDGTIKSSPTDYVFDSLPSAIDKVRKLVDLEKWTWFYVKEENE